MGIKNGLTPRFSEVGKIKIGGKGEERTSKNNKKFRPPVKYDHFVVTTTERDKNGNFIRDISVHEKIGEKPKEISILLPFDDLDMNFYTAFQMYEGKKRKCDGDGETATRYLKDGGTKKVECNPETCQFLQGDSPKCKPTGILSCHIKETMEIGSIYRFRTHSWNTVSGILSALKYFKDNTNGILQGLPLKLKMIKKSTEEHGNVNIVTIVIDGIEMMKMRQMALDEFESRKLLGVQMQQIEQQVKDAGFNPEENDDPEDVEGEFYTPDIIPEVKGTTPEDAAGALKEKIQDGEIIEEDDDEADGAEHGSLL